MPENLLLYCQTHDALPEALMDFLALDADLQQQQSPEGLQYIYNWGDLVITCTVLPEARLKRHLEGFGTWIKQNQGERPDDYIEQLLGQVNRTRLVVAVQVSTAIEERAEAVLEKLSDGLRPFVFQNNSLRGWQGGVVLEQVEIAPEPPPLDTDGGTSKQIARAERSRALLLPRKAPLYSGAMFVPDDDTIGLRHPADVAHRALVLYILARRAEGAEHGDTLELLKATGLWDFTSAEERGYLEEEEPEPGESQKLLWRYEAVWTLLWALGKTDDLEWPGKPIGVDRIDAIVAPLAPDPKFIEQAHLRPVEEILDARDLMLRLHWAIRHEYRHGHLLPHDLDWSHGRKDERMLAMIVCPAVNVVEQRHRALNWLCHDGDADWDDVDTPT